MESTPQTAAETKLPRVLIADDNPQGVELLEAYLAECDYEIRTAADGEETLSVINTWHPDLILLDIMMPKISGFEVCKRLRANAATPDVAALILTTLPHPTDTTPPAEPGSHYFLP